jgi:hypothetical protein
VIPKTSQTTKSMRVVNFEIHLLPNHNSFCFKFFPNCKLTPQTESMFHSVSLCVPYFENEWAKSKWVNTKVVVSKVYYNCKKTWSKKQLRFGSKWISKLTTHIDSVVWLGFGITKKIGNSSFFLAKMTSIFYNMLLYII